MAESNELQAFVGKVHFRRNRAENFGSGNQVFRREGVADAFYFALGFLSHSSVGNVGQVGFEQ